MNHTFRQHVQWVFVIAVAWYGVSVLCDVVFPGMISTVIDLDWFLIAVILLAVFSFVIQRKKL